MPPMTLRLPTDAQRITIIGKTGSGKTQGAAWLLAHRSFDKKPWIILDFKYDELLGEISGIKEIGVRDALPKKPGLYICHPLPKADDEAVEDLLWKIHARGNTGLFIDEGYMIPDRSEAMQAILTQGRSKRIPVMMLTQRPAWLTRFAFSEADYIQLYQVTDKRDIITAKQFMPLPIEKRLPAPYYSFWWDNARNYKAVLQPSPSKDIILDTFHERLSNRKGIL
jgi:hypothetical protein